MQGDGKGFLDVILIRVRNPPSENGRMVVAELKTVKGKTSPEQDEWLAAFRSVCQDTYLWTPNDWPEIERVLGS